MVVDATPLSGAWGRGVQGDKVGMSSPHLAREWAKSQQSIAAYLSSLVPNFNEAEEFLQETAAQVFEHADRYDSTRPFLPWALGIARNVVLGHRRQAAQRRRLFDDVIMEELAREFEELAEHRAVLCEALAGCQEHLPERHRQLCRLRYEEGCSPQEIAEKIGGSAGRVRTVLHRIREQLRTCVERKVRLEGVRL